MRTWGEGVLRPQEKRWEGYFRNHPCRQEPLGCHLIHPQDPGLTLMQNARV